MNKTTVNHQDWLREQLASDDEFMLAYLQSALEESESDEEVLLAFRAVVEAKGIVNVARQIGVQRESLSRALRPDGNPTFKTLSGILKFLGLKVSVSQDHDKHAHA